MKEKQGRHVCYASVGERHHCDRARATPRRGWRHILSSDTPFRLGGYRPGLTFHRVETPAYPLFREPHRCRSRTDRAGSSLSNSTSHAHTRFPLRRRTGASDSGCDRPRSRPSVITTLHGPTSCRQRPVVSETAFCIEQSDGVTAVSESLRADITESSQYCRYRVIPNFLGALHRRVEASSVRSRLIGDEAANRNPRPTSVRSNVWTP
jgi:hypothetical protein